MLTISVAAALAMLGIVCVVVYVNGANMRAIDNADPVWAVAAKNTIPAGTTGAGIDGDDAACGRDLQFFDLVDDADGEGLVSGEAPLLAEQFRGVGSGQVGALLDDGADPFFVGGEPQPARTPVAKPIDAAHLISMRKHVSIGRIITADLPSATGGPPPAVSRPARFEPGRTARPGPGGISPAGARRRSGI